MTRPVLIFNDYINQTIFSDYMNRQVLVRNKIYIYIYIYIYINLSAMLFDT